MSAVRPLDGGHQSLYWVGRCSEFLGGVDLFPHVMDLTEDAALIRGIEQCVAAEPSWQTKKFDSLFQFRLFRILLYAIVRAAQPAVVLETGVLHGLTSAFLLRACQRSVQSRLISVDLPSYAETGPANRDGYIATLPPGRQPGWLIPPFLLPQWTLHLGASHAVLPSIRQEVGEVGLFIHDSDHTDENMTFELEYAWDVLSADGILVCDNIDSCEAFDRFCRRVGRPSLRLPTPDLTMMTQARFGVIRRTPS